MSEQLSDIWWLVSLEGIAMLVLGILLLTAPGITMVTLVVFLGVTWLVSGILSTVRVFLKDSDVNWGLLLARGILGIQAGIFVLGYLLYGSVSVQAVLVVILGISATIMGIISLIQVFKGDGWGAMILGATNIVFGIILFASRLVPTDVLPLVLGIIGLIGGLLLIILSFRIRRNAELAAV